MPADTPAHLFNSPAQLLDIYDLMRLKRIRSRTTVYALVKRGQLPKPRDKDRLNGRPRWRLSDFVAPEAA
jgi:predicted DNA-binding transcriptional regulator AlpA